MSKTLQTTQIITKHADLLFHCAWHLLEMT
jgi:hypothetical protein